MLPVKIEFNLNGRSTSVSVPPDMSALTMLREKLDLTGAKLACGEGECGACTILVDDLTVNSCLMFAVRAFVEHGAIQCGYCMPGMIMQAKYLVRKNPGINREEIKRNLEGNICRCTGYRKVIDAVADVATGARKVSTL
jgi:carbon-monoxide dehydrogenase small subunit